MNLTSIRACEYTFRASIETSFDMTQHINGSGVARIEESAGPEPQGVGRVDLWRHLPSESVLGPMQCATTRIDSLNVNESARGGYVRQPDPRG